MEEETQVQPADFDLMVPAVEEPRAPVAMDPHNEGLPAQFPQGAGLGFTMQETDREQMQHKEVWRQTIEQSAAASVIQYLQDAPSAFNELWENGSSDLEPHREELTAGIPLHLQDNIMRSHTLVGAQARRQRFLEDQRQQARLAQQVGMSRGAIAMAAGLIDADLPLMFASGGTLAAARTAGTVARTTKALTGSTALGRVGGDFAVGITGGAISGTIVGGLESMARDDRDINTFFTQVLASAALGGVLNPTIGRISPDNYWAKAADNEMQTALREFETSLQRQIMDPTDPLHSRTSPVDDVDMAPQGPVVIDLEPNRLPNYGSVGAASTGAHQFRQQLSDAGAPQSVIDRADESFQWRQTYDFERLRAMDTENPLVNLITGGSNATMKIPFTDRSINVGHWTGRAFTWAQRDFTQLVHSNAPSANFVAAEILESASGIARSGSSSAVLKEFFHSSAMVHTGRSIKDARAAFIRSRGLSPVSVDSSKQFSRELRLAMDEYYHTGNLAKEWKDVVENIDATHREMLGHMKGIDEARSVRGARDIDHRAGYFRYAWEPERFSKFVQQFGEDALTRAFRDGYMRGSGLDAVLAGKVAKAIVRRFSDRGIGVGGADSRLLDLDSRSGIEAVLEGSGLAQHEIDSIMKRLDVNTQERTQKGFLRGRTDVDLSVNIPGSQHKLVDLMSDDFERTLQQYVGDASGAAALANKGIRDKADLDRLMDSMLYEQRALGEEGLTRPQLEAIFSQFGGGIHKGYLWGHQTNGVNPLTSSLTKATRASLLQRVGMTQLMDTANLFVGNGVANTMEPLMAKLGWNKVGKMTRDQLDNIHKELESIGVIVGKDHDLFAPHLTIDETELAGNVVGQTIQNGLSSVERATNFASGQIHVTKIQQEVAASAITTNVMRTLAGQDTNLTPRMLRDLGLDTRHIRQIHDMIKRGDIEVNGADINLNSANWDAELRLEFGAAITRGVHQQVQKNFIGETSVWMNTDVGKLLSSLKTFGLVASQKQMARNLIIGGSPQIIQAAAWQLGFAYAVLSLSQAISGTEMSPVDRARLAVAYTPTMGTIPMLSDPVTSMLGFDDVNFSPYGRYSNFLDTPVFDTVGKLVRSGGSIADTLTGDGDYEDMQNAKAMFFMNWYGMKRVWEAM